MANFDDLLFEDGFIFERQDAFFEVAQELSNYIKELPLTNEQNDKLVRLMVKQAQEAEHSGYLFGVRTGAKMQKFGFFDKIGGKDD